MSDIVSSTVRRHIDVDCCTINISKIISCWKFPCTKICYEEQLSNLIWIESRKFLRILCVLKWIRKMHKWITLCWWTQCSTNWSIIEKQDELNNPIGQISLFVYVNQMKSSVDLIKMKTISIWWYSLNPICRLTVFASCKKENNQICPFTMLKGAKWREHLSYFYFHANGDKFKEDLISGQWFVLFQVIVLISSEEKDRISSRSDLRLVCSDGCRSSLK